jgi:serine/threonine protein phosphatase PrpC
LADGIGSHYKSELASKQCVNKLKDIIENLDSLQKLDLRSHYKDVQLSLLDFAKKSEEIDFETIDKRKSLGTTLICVLDCGEYYSISYTGNGSVWHVDGRFNAFGKNYYLPWNSINLLNPHCIPEDGKSALYRYLSIYDVQFEPSVLTLQKNKFIPGEILIVTTDGIFSNDAVPVAKDQNNTIWIRGEETMPLLYSHLSKFLRSNIQVADSAMLDVALMSYLTELKSLEIMHDDTTIGVIISERTISFHQSEYEIRITSVISSETNQGQ